MTEAMNVASVQPQPEPVVVRVRPLRAKRLLDVVCAAGAIVVLSPLMLIVAVLVKCTSRGPILFRQERVGAGNSRFMMLKFRSMIVNDDDSALREAVRLELAGSREATNGSFKLANDPRITRVGKWIRATSIDELPQLFNVLRGEMSMVGPRPALPWEADLFPAEFALRTAVRPGITGLWQVSGRSTLSTLEMLELDVEYVETRSLVGDIGIMLRTPAGAAPRRRGAVVATLLVATTGGHLAQMVDIVERLPDDNARVWVTHENAQSRSLLADEQVVYVPYVGVKDVAGVSRNIAIAHRLFKEWRFTRAVSTGSGIALGYLPYCADTRGFDALHRERDAHGPPLAHGTRVAPDSTRAHVHAVSEQREQELALRRIGLRRIRRRCPRTETGSSGGSS